jgi:hypothetical protein
MWSQCDDSELRYNEREGTARTVQSIESEQGHTSGSGRQRRHGLTRSVMRGATLGTSSMGMALAFSFLKGSFRNLVTFKVCYDRRVITTSLGRSVLKIYFR